MKYCHAIVAFIIAFAALPADAAIAPHVDPAEKTCSASSVLNAVGDALTTGKDANVLSAALSGERHLALCGDEHDAIGAELIVADAYGDVNEPAARCRALHDAARRSAKLGERSRVRHIAAAAAGCGK